MQAIRITANDLEFEVLVAGSSDRLLLMLHGFPDDARSFIPMMQRLSEAGFCCAAPFMRGYRPSEVPEPVRRCSLATTQIADLATDVAKLSQALKARLGCKSVYLAGHDWGAITVQAAINRNPELYRKAVMMSVPPGRVFLGNLLRNPGQLARSWYILFFQLPWLPESRLRSSKSRFIARLWRAWSGDMTRFQQRIDEVTATLSEPVNARAAMAYYRGLLRPSPADCGRWLLSRKLFLGALKGPVLVLSGERDRCITPAMFRHCDRAVAPFGGRYRMIEGAGHFLPLEAPDPVIEETLRFFRESDEESPTGSKPGRMQ